MRTQFTLSQDFKVFVPVLVFPKLLVTNPGAPPIAFPPNLATKNLCTSSEKPVI